MSGKGEKDTDAAQRTEILCATMMAEIIVCVMLMIGQLWCVVPIMIHGKHTIMYI